MKLEGDMAIQASRSKPMLDETTSPKQDGVLPTEELHTTVSEEEHKPPWEENKVKFHEHQGEQDKEAKQVPLLITIFTYSLWGLDGTKISRSDLAQWLAWKEVYKERLKVEESHGPKEMIFEKAPIKKKDTTEGILKELHGSTRLHQHKQLNLSNHDVQHKKDPT